MTLDKKITTALKDNSELKLKLDAAEEVILRLQSLNVDLKQATVEMGQHQTDVELMVLENAMQIQELKTVVMGETPTESEE